MISTLENTTILSAWAKVLQSDGPKCNLNAVWKTWINRDVHHPRDGEMDLVVGEMSPRCLLKVLSPQAKAKGDWTFCIMWFPEWAANWNSTLCIPSQHAVWFKMKFPQWKYDNSSINQPTCGAPLFRSLHVCSSVRFLVYPQIPYYNYNGFTKLPWTCRVPLSECDVYMIRIGPGMPYHYYNLRVVLCWYLGKLPIYCTNLNWVHEGIT